MNDEYWDWQLLDAYVLQVERTITALRHFIFTTTHACARDLAAAARFRSVVFLTITFL